MNSTASWPSSITLVVIDFYGVMTDNTVQVGADGTETVRCHRSDGLGIAAMRKAGVPMMVFSTEEHPVVAARCKKLQLPCHQGIANKATWLAEFLKKEKIDPKAVAYLGNDRNDLECLQMVGFPVVVADADASVIGVARVVLSKAGGKGAVREFCDKFLALRAS